MNKTQKTKLRREERRFVEQYVQQYIDNMDKLFLDGKIDQCTYNKYLHYLLSQAETVYLKISRI